MVDAVIAVIAGLLAPKSRLILAEWPENKYNERDKQWENRNGQWRCTVVGTAGGGELRSFKRETRSWDDGTWEKVALCHPVLLHTSFFFVIHKN